MPKLPSTGLSRDHPIVPDCPGPRLIRRGQGALGGAPDILTVDSLGIPLES